MKRLLCCLFAIAGLVAVVPRAAAQARCSSLPRRKRTSHKSRSEGGGAPSAAGGGEARSSSWAGAGPPGRAPNFLNSARIASGLTAKRRAVFCA